MFDLDHIRIHTLERRERLVRIRQGALLHYKYNMIMIYSDFKKKIDCFRNIESKIILVVPTPETVGDPG